MDTGVPLLYSRQNCRPGRKRVVRITCTVLLSLLLAPGLCVSADYDYSALILSMQENPRGPFSRIRWFCNDGTVLPPEAYACREHGGGYQHGEWSAETVKLRRSVREVLRPPPPRPLCF